MLKPLLTYSDPDVEFWAAFEAIHHGLDLHGIELEKFANHAADAVDEVRLLKAQVKALQATLRDLTLTAAFNRAAATVQRLEAEVAK